MLNFLGVIRWEGALLILSLYKTFERLAISPNLFLSCVPYDSYGIMIKKDIESCVLSLVERYKALYIVHDSVYKILRVLDGLLLRDRLVNRPLRLKIYNSIVYLIFALAGIAARFTKRGG